MCSNESLDALNTQYGDGTAALIVRYGAYKNWGRWNHNRRRIHDLVDALASAGATFQLQHDAVEPDDDLPHGGVAIFDAATGAELCRHADLQHNRYSHEQRAAALQALAAHALAALSSRAAQADKIEPDEA